MRLLSSAILALALVVNLCTCTEAYRLADMKCRIINQTMHLKICYVSRFPYACVLFPFFFVFEIQKLVSMVTFVLDA